MSKQLAIREDPTYAPLAARSKKRSYVTDETSATYTTDGTQKRLRLDVPSFTQQPGHEQLQGPTKDLKQLDPVPAHPLVLHSRAQAVRFKGLPNTALLPPGSTTGGNSLALTPALPPLGPLSAVQPQPTLRPMLRQHDLSDKQFQQRGARSIPDLSLSTPTVETLMITPKANSSAAEGAANYRKEYEALLASPEPSRWSPARPRYVDPMLQTSTRVRSEERNLVGRPFHNGLLESGIGIVLSEVHLVAMPLGSMIELANKYPEEVKESSTEAGDGL